jgi:hypothetical protein
MRKNEFLIKKKSPNHYFLEKVPIIWIGNFKNPQKIHKKIPSKIMPY